MRKLLAILCNDKHSFHYLYDNALFPTGFFVIVKHNRKNGSTAYFASVAA
jgi:hypothetical protein